MYKRQQEKPYQGFETELEDQVCSCMSLQKIINENNFLKKYEECQQKISALLKNGLDQYPEDPRLSKEEFKERLSGIIEDLVKNNNCKNDF